MAAATGVSIALSDHANILFYRASASCIDACRHAPFSRALNVFPVGKPSRPGDAYKPFSRIRRSEFRRRELWVSADISGHPGSRPSDLGLEEEHGEADLGRGRVGFAARKVEESIGISTSAAELEKEGSARGLIGEAGTKNAFPSRVVPDRYKVVVATALAFVICNMDKVNMSVAIIPMSHSLGWSASTAGLVQSAFFWGYATSQLPGGWLAQRFTGKRVLLWGVFAWSAATALIPCVASFIPGIMLMRMLVGLGEGVSPPAATDLIAKAIPISERSRAVSTVFGGLNVGSVSGLLMAPVIIERFGWQPVFYVFGVLGIIWCAYFSQLESEEGLEVVLEHELEQRHQLDELEQHVRYERGDVGDTSSSGSGWQPGPLTGTSPVEGGHNSTATTSQPPGLRHRPASNQPGSVREGKGEGAPTPAAGGLSHGHHHGALPDRHSEGHMPWAAFFRSPAVWAMIYGHFCNNWGHYTLLSWLPSYFSDSLKLSLVNSALVSLLPPMASVIVAAFAAPFADSLIQSGTGLTTVRKVFQTIAFIGPAVCMAAVALTPSMAPWLVVTTLTVGLGIGAFSLSGLYCNHQDISPKYAGVLLGITNTAGALPGIFGVALTGYLIDATGNWQLSLFAPSVFFYLTGAVVWNLCASSKPQSFET